MIKRRALKFAGGWLLLVGIIAAIGFFALAPKITEKSLNIVLDKKLPPVSDAAKALHKTLTIVDLHSDSLLWDRDITQRAGYGHMDLPRLRDGNVAIQIFSSVTKSPRGQNYESNNADTDNITPLVIAQLQPIRTWGSLLQRTLYHGEKLETAAQESEGTVSYIRSSQNVKTMLESRSAGKDITGAIFSAEGLQNLEGKRENLNKLYDAGMRMAGFTHFFDNRLAGSMHGEKKGGLTDFGRQIMRDMEDKGIIVDIAHCSHTCVGEMLKAARRPLVSSHGGVQATCGVNRNLTNEEIRGVAATGGVIGVGYWPAAVCDTDPAAIARAMKHIRDLVGIEHVALGSDYDGSVTVGFDTSDLVHVTQALITAGFSDKEIRAAMGGNAIRVLQRGLIPLAQLPADKTSGQTAKNKDAG